MGIGRATLRRKHIGFLTHNEVNLTIFRSG